MNARTLFPSLVHCEEITSPARQVDLRTAPVLLVRPRLAPNVRLQLSSFVSIDSRDPERRMARPVLVATSRRHDRPPHGARSTLISLATGKRSAMPGQLSVCAPSQSKAYAASEKGARGFAAARQSRRDRRRARLRRSPRRLEALSRGDSARTPVCSLRAIPPLTTPRTPYPRHVPGPESVRMRPRPRRTTPWSRSTVNGRGRSARTILAWPPCQAR